MTTDPEHLPDVVARGLDRLADEDAAEVLAEARARAHARVTAVLEEALVARLLARTLPAAQDDPLPDAVVQPDPVAHDHPVVHDQGDAGEVLYLYGIVSADAPKVPATSGVGPGNPIEVVAHDRLAAVLSRVPLSEFGDEHLKRNLEQMEWLERTARRHEAVLDSIREQSTVIPMRICTLFSDADSVRSLLARESEALQRALARLAGHNEWGVKGLVDVAEAERALAAGTSASAPRERPASGRDYLQSKQAERRTADEVRRWVREAAAEVHDALTARATAALRNPPQPRELTGYQAEMVLNGVYLVADDEVEAFSGLVGDLDNRHRSHGMRLELTGPWPPYNFVPPLAAA